MTPKSKLTVKDVLYAVNCLGDTVIRVRGGKPGVGAYQLKRSGAFIPAPVAREVLSKHSKEIEHATSQK